MHTLKSHAPSLGKEKASLLLPRRQADQRAPYAADPAKAITKLYEQSGAWKRAAATTTVAAAAAAAAAACDSIFCHALGGPSPIWGV